MFLVEKKYYIFSCNHTLYIAISSLNTDQRVIIYRNNKNLNVFRGSVHYSPWFNILPSLAASLPLRNYCSRPIRCATFGCVTRANPEERLLALAAEIRELSLSVYLRLPVRSGPLDCIRYYPRVRRYMRASGISPMVNRHRHSREEFATGSRLSS